MLPWTDVVGPLLQGKKGGKDMGKGALILSRMDLFQSDQEGDASRTRSVEVTHRLRVDNVSLPVSRPARRRLVGRYLLPCLSFAW